jgi:hypothetical protein
MVNKVNVVNLSLDRLREKETELRVCFRGVHIRSVCVSGNQLVVSSFEDGMCTV